MGPYRLIFSMMPLLLATGALAQQQDSGGPVMNLPRGNTQNAPDNRQGPELDVFRDPVTPTVAPPPAVALPPVMTPTTPPPAAPQPTAQTPAPRRETRPSEAQPESRTERNAQRNEPRQAETPAPEQSESTTGEAPSTAAPEPQAAPAPNEAANAALAPTEPTPAAEASNEGLPWLWIVGGIVLLAAAFFFLRRRRNESDEDEVAPEPVEPVLAEPVAEETAPPPPPPAPVAPPPPAPTPTPMPEAVADTTTDRAQIDLSLEVTGARNSLMGLTIAYALTLTNRGERTAQDVLVRGLIGNASGDQQTLLQQFVSGHSGLPLHSAVAIAPGASQRLTGELRLTADQIVPVPMGERLLLIPLTAFDVQYRWGEDSTDPAGTGRTGGAFIVGQEQEPRAERLSPFRLDLGPRQYRRPGARVARQFGRN